MRILTLTTLAITAFIVSSPSPGRAQDADMEFDLAETKRSKRANSGPTRSSRSKSPLRVEAYGRFTFGGGVGFNFDGAPAGISPSLDLNPALGVGGGLEYVLHDFFSIGGSLVSHDYADDSTDAAFTLGFLGGADYFLSNSIAIFGEFGFQWHTHGIDTNGLGDASVDITYVFMHFGAKLAL